MNFVLKTLTNLAFAAMIFLPSFVHAEMQNGSCQKLIDQYPYVEAYVDDGMRCWYGTYYKKEYVYTEGGWIKVDPIINEKISGKPTIIGKHAVGKKNYYFDIRGEDMLQNILDGYEFLDCPCGKETRIIDGDGIVNDREEEYCPCPNVKADQPTKK